MWYTSYTEGVFFFSSSLSKGKHQYPRVGAACDGFQRPVSDCVGDGVDDIIKYSYFLLQLSESMS